MNMIEKVARAMCRGNGCEDPEMLSSPDDEPAWSYYIPLARAAIEAMKEPTKEMHNAWEQGYYDGFNEVPDTEKLDRSTAFKCFCSANAAMISVALKE